MRTMVKGETKLKVVEHIILRNFWEYYVTDEPECYPGVKFCLVMGFETELGDVPMDEIKHHIWTRTKDLKQVAPAGGWSWEN